MALRALALVMSTLAAAPEPAPASAQSAQDAVAQQALASGITPEIASKLTGEQLHDILRHNNNAGVPAIAYVATVGTFLTVLLVVGFALYRGHLKDVARQATLRLVIERGGQIPPELLSPPHKPMTDLKWGVLLVSFGIGLSAAIGLIDVEGLAIGLLPICVGVGYLIVWALGRNERTARAS